MKIKKTYQGSVPLNRISNQGDNSELNTYSTQYLNEKLYSFSQSQPKNNEGIWFQQGKNLFNKNDVMVGWLNEDGSIYYEETYRTSNFISVKPGVQYYKTATNSARFKFYDADLNPLTNQYNDIVNADQALAFIVPDNAHYIRFSMKIEYIHDVQVEVGNSATEYEEYVGEHLYFKNELGYKEFHNSDVAIGSRQPINEESIWMYIGKNLLNSNSLVPQNKNRATTTQTATGFDFTFITPLVGSGEGYYTNDILFKQGVTYYMHCDSSTGVRFGNVRLTDDINNIDSNFQAWTQGTNGLDFFITPNQDYHCMRIWVTNSAGSESASDTGSIFNMMITGGDVPSNYEPYIEPQILIRQEESYYRAFPMEQKHILCAYLSAETTKTTGADQRAKVPLDAYELVGSKLSFNPDKKAIIIGEGVRHISIKASIMYYQPGSSSNRSLDIAINGSSKKQKLETLYGNTRTYGSIEMEMPIVSVEAGDVITLLLRTVAQTNQDVTMYEGMGCTYLCVEVID